ncbi:MAG: hypothetical protein NT029_13950 [Armatimonadetes bacterium]|nr:hypothetical protein [Armatimonadota bacterium]
MPTRLYTLTALLALAACSASAQRPQTTGAYADRTGAKQPWTIAGNNMLVWNGKPWTPVGGIFCPACLADKADEAAWQRDVADLAVLKGKGLLDLLVEPGRPITDVSPAALQRLVDQLDADGFRYGLGFGGGVAQSASGYVVRPAAYRIPGVREGSDTSWDARDADVARYVLVDDRDGTQVVQDGLLRARDGSFTVIAGPRAGEGSVAILYPHKTMNAGREGAMPDVWSCYDAYRDRLLQLFSSVKFGPGLRFFMDPLAQRVSVAGEADYLVPDSRAFRTEWEAYLGRRYSTIEELLTGWAVVDRELRSVREAASLCPMWADQKGIPFLMDITTGRRYQVNPVESKFWSDLRECRNDSLIYYMNGIADLLKREVANVPVVHTHTAQHRLFSTPGKSGGFDGLGIAAYGRGSALATAGADSAYGQATEASHTLWVLVSETMEITTSPKSQAGYGSQDTMQYDLDWFRSLGARGIFVNAFRAPAGERWSNYSLLDVPAQLDWLKSFADRMNRQAADAASAPKMLPYPASAAGMVKSGPIGSKGVWWVPSLAKGQAVDYGAAYAGYTISLPEGDTLVLWSQRGDRETRLAVTDPRKLAATTPDGIPVALKIDMKGHTAKLMITEQPTIIRTGGQDLLPVEAAEDAIRQLRQLVDQAAAQHLPIQEIRYQLQRAETKVKVRDLTFGLAIAQQAIAAVVDLLQPFTWREAETADSSTFGDSAREEGASGKAFLTLDTDTRPATEGYTVQYRITVPADDSYTLWVAASPQTPNASRFAWTIDTRVSGSSADASAVGSSYLGDRFVWLNLGKAQLARGPHTITLRVTDRAAATNRYFLSMDAVLLTRHAFTPRGTAKPSPDGL